MPPRIPKIKLPTHPLEPLREIVRGGRERLEEAGNDIRSIAEEFHGGTPNTTSTIQEIIKAPKTCRSGGLKPGRVSLLFWQSL